MHVLEVLIRPFAPHACLNCSRPGLLLCSHCVLPAAPVCDDGVWAPFAYDGTAQAIVHALKFESKRAAAGVMADRLLPLPWPVEVVTFVPTAGPRYRQRGFDQAELLARALAKELGLPCWRLLRRTSNARQVGASREQRQAQAATAYQLRTGFTLSGQRILLVDDVVSTGSTLRAAAQLLRAEGAQVYPLAFARQPLKGKLK